MKLGQFWRWYAPLLSGVLVAAIVAIIVTSLQVRFLQAIADSDHEHQGGTTTTHLSDTHYAFSSLVAGTGAVGRGSPGQAAAEIAERLRRSTISGVCGLRLFVPDLGETGRFGVRIIVLLTCCVAAGFLCRSAAVYSTRSRLSQCRGIRSIVERSQLRSNALAVLVTLSLFVAVAIPASALAWTVLLDTAWPLVHEQRAMYPTFGMILLATLIAAGATLICLLPVTWLALRWVIPANLLLRTPRCAICGYAFNGLPIAAVCPECGSGPRERRAPRAWLVRIRRVVPAQARYALYASAVLVPLSLLAVFGLGLDVRAGSETLRQLRRTPAYLLARGILSSREADSLILWNPCDPRPRMVRWSGVDGGTCIVLHDWAACSNPTERASLTTVWYWTDDEQPRSIASAWTFASRQDHMLPSRSMIAQVILDCGHERALRLLGAVPNVLATTRAHPHPASIEIVEEDSELKDVVRALRAHLPDRAVRTDGMP
ncbi:MAG: hypothetical protein IT438_16980 [Phycisphaerales bacterium]|nr:hypothetical protein [Phycisphaerales bacterium]